MKSVEFCYWLTKTRYLTINLTYVKNGAVGHVSSIAASETISDGNAFTMMKMGRSRQGNSGQHVRAVRCSLAVALRVR